MVGDESRASGFGGVGAREEAREATRGAWRPRYGRWSAGKCRRIALERTQHQTDQLHQHKQRADGGGHQIHDPPGISGQNPRSRSEEHTSEVQSLMRISYAVFCLKKKKKCTTY